MENLEVTNINQIIARTEEILGCRKMKEKLELYNDYINLKLENKVSFGNYNCIVECRSNGNQYNQVLEIINQILIEKGIVKEKFTYLTLKNIDDVKFEGNKLYVISYENEDIFRNEYREIMKKYYNNVFIVVASARINDAQIFYSGEIYWKFIIDRISVDEKKKYIQKKISEEDFYLREDIGIVEAITNNKMFEINETLINGFVKAKKDNSIVLDDRYFDIKCVVEEEKIEKTALKQLDELIGLENVKRQIKQIIDYVEVHKRRGNMPALHMVFSGNPGTGKTKVARIVGEIFAELEILDKKKNFCEVTRENLIAEYVGQTAIKTKSVINSALGGVLFIDEAYSLGNTFDEKRQDFGPECISTLIKEMEDKRDNLCVILAGYKNEMENLMKMNPGFRSRIQFFVDFEDYTEIELYEIFKQFADNEKFVFDIDVKEKLIEYFKNEISNKDENFGNARLARNLFEKIKFEQASRIKRENCENLDLITKEDITNVCKNTKKNCGVKIGFQI